MGILAWIVFGLIVGIVAKWIVPGAGFGGVLGDIIVGIIGAFLGGWIYGFFAHVGVTGFNIPSMVCALIGAFVLFAPIYGNGTINRLRSTFQISTDASLQVRDVNRHFIQPYSYSHPIGGGIRGEVRHFKRRDRSGGVE